MKNLSSIGKTLKKIRVNKGISPSELVRTQGLSPSTLSHVETGNRIPTLENLLKILDGIDISFREILYITEGYQLTKKEKIIKNFRSINQSTEYEKMMHIKHEIKQYLHEHPAENFLQHLFTLISIYEQIQREQTFNLVNEEAELLVKKLMDRKEWTYFDMYLVSKLFMFFPKKHENALIQKVIDTCYKYNDLDNTERLLSSFLLNCAHYFFENKAYDKADKLLTEAEFYSLTHTQYDIYYSVRFITAASNYIRFPKKKKESEEEINYIIQHMRYIQNTALANAMENDFLKYKD
ncbi:helix-turn-helix domain-containing protein [Listeria booriae]|uniref:Helix-turn-helix domain-containing protein n=1 Tax=Listeria booriae TaxID=1552123 RepID=A0A841XTR8_9LIST|nr:Rgg/GadR/MutR family transcriptional regulator [Listeria booriae]MBC1318524.1 helix-turn-helix domain-containing protein [Listeria booriae]MBC2388833.1 helix-turn-helix domain-containing protein [Listeria booriae]